MAAEDLRWMLKLCADKNKKAIRYYGQGISEKDFEHACGLISQVLAGQQSMTKEAIIASLSKRTLT